MRHALLLVTLLTPTLGHAWGRDGHNVVGEIAWRHLNGEARAQVEALLGEFEEPGTDLAEVTTWADEIRGQPEWDHAQPWHYVNLPPGNTDGYNAERDCPPEGCVVEAIVRFSEVLRGETASAEARNQALKFLAHFVGDVHQPLHASHGEDYGGNGIRVTFLGSEMNLHGLWDYGMINHLGLDWEEYTDQVMENVTEEMVREWWTTDVVQWTNESYRLAVENAYQVPEDGELGQEYLDRNLPVISERLAMGGIRFAALLNEIWPGEAAPASEDTAPSEAVPVSSP
jgi:hypothetical protein